MFLTGVRAATEFSTNWSVFGTTNADELALSAKTASTVNFILSE
jgi:hypothetical protein